MKKKFFFLPLLAALVLAGCSKEESEDAGGNNGETDMHYLAVSIATTPNAGGRAGEGTDTGSSNNPYVQNGGSYEDGLEAESKVNKVRFYFFRQTGVAVNVTGNVNYIDVDYPGTSGPNTGETVSDELNAVLIVNTAKGDRLPSQMLALINPPVSSLPEGSLDREFFKNRVYDYTEYTTIGPEDKRANGFVMTNSVYFNSQNKLEDITEIDPSHYAKSEAEAKTDEKVLKIYVERCVAKVRLNIDNTLRPSSVKEAEDNDNLLVSGADGKTHSLTRLMYKETVDGADVEKPLTIRRTRTETQTDAEGNTVTVSIPYNMSVYAELQGWNVTADRPQSYLIKHLDDTWKTTAPSGMTEAWNIPTLHRCFWAAYCAHADGGNLFHDFADSHKQSFEKNNNFTYCNENAQLKNNVMATKVIIPAVLCDSTATPLMLCEFAGQRFVDDASLTNMKNTVLSMMKVGQNEFWTEDKNQSTAENKVYREMGPDDIEFKTYYDVISPDKENRYYTKAVLTEEAGKLTWLKRDPSRETLEWTGDDLNKVMENFSHLRIWNEGKAYYYIDIPHLGSSGDTQYGVVRNHVYDITVKGIYGLGTPVYNPDQKIIPETVNPDEVYIAAQVNILSWRLVQREVSIDWGK